jgi:hypothetical protein
MRNSTTADFGTVPQKFLFRLNWPFFWPAAGMTPETLRPKIGKAPALCHPKRAGFKFHKLIENVLANAPAASVNYLCELFFAERADFFHQSGFIDCGDLAYHDNAGFWQIRDAFFQANVIWNSSKFLI